MIALEAETVFELWESIKSYVPAKEKLEVAEIFIKAVDEAGLSQVDIEVLCDDDKILYEAVRRYYVEDDDFDEEEDDWN